MGVSRGGARWAAVSALLLLVSGGVIVAQIPEISSQIQPIPAGPFQLYPLFVTALEQTDNLFFSSVNPVSATIFSATPGISAQLPMRRSFAEVAYAMRYRSYGGSELESNLSHFFRARGDFGFASGVEVSFVDDFQSGVLDTQNFDPGGEVRFLGDSFKSNAFAVNVAHQRDTRAVGVTVGSTRVDFDPSERVSRFFDTEAAFVRFYGETRRSARTWLLAEMTVGQSKLSRTILGVPDDRDRDTTKVGAGVRWILSPGSRLNATVVYAVEEFTSPGGSTDYRGLVGNVTYVSAVPARPRLSVGLNREVFPSVYLDSDYYVSSRISVQIESPTRAKLKIGCRLGFFRNDYPESVLERVDDTWDGKLWVGYRMRQRLGWSVYARKIERESGLPGENPITGESLAPLDYSATSYGIVLQLGG